MNPAGVRRISQNLVPRDGRLPCFWCRAPFWRRQLTDDHVKPQAVGGDNRAGNIVRACGPCNTDRGRIVSAWIICLELECDVPNRDARVRRFRKRLPEILALQAAWAKLEIERLGRSPSAEFKLEVHDKPKWPAKDAKSVRHKSYNTDLTAARKAAEWKVWTTERDALLRWEDDGGR